ncbi:uncharacterized protein LOC133525813 [Cydia pomonella]|uniref:uncharacterized protein LOC133525813 n=1 Tax=Cydia pomonella TaxID=82600 RepID=UPI002ADD589F|nr:uncharacterized protein LOC133525813 [Cydia pomonella]
MRRHVSLPAPHRGSSTAKILAERYVLRVEARARGEHLDPEAQSGQTGRLRATQVVTGHGCFGHYLHQIQRELGPQCHECGDPDDSAQQTLEMCSRWEGERRTLMRAIRTTDLSLHSVVAAMLGSERKWKAVVSFCEEVISQKEAAEREREDAADAPPLRHRRRGRARAQYAAANRALPR